MIRLPNWLRRLVGLVPQRMRHQRLYQPPLWSRREDVLLPDAPLSTVLLSQQLRSKGCPIPKSIS